MVKDKVFVFGASGHAKVVIDIIERQGRYEIALLVDDDPALAGSTVYGYPVIGGKSVLRVDNISKGVVAIGSNRARESVAAWLVNNGFELITAIHPSVQIARGVDIGKGTVMMAGACINSDSTIGCNVIINTNSSVDHDCSIGDCVHIAPGSVLCGTVTVGSGTFICAGATVIPNTTIGSQAVIGAGSTVICDVPDNVTVVGSPAQKVNK